MASTNQGLVSQVGPIRVDWPRSVGYFGGVALAVSAGLIEPPLGIFIAAIPFIKMLNRPNAPFSVRLVSQFMDGASKPVGGDGESTVTLEPERSSGRRALGGIAGRLGDGTRGIWDDAQKLR